VAFTSVCLESRWLGPNSGFYVLERPCRCPLKRLEGVHGNRQVPADLYMRSRNRRRGPLGGHERRQS